MTALQREDLEFYNSHFDEGGDDYAPRMCDLASSHLPMVLPVLQREVPQQFDTLIEIGSGSGSWGIMMSKVFQARHTILCDISLNGLRNLDRVIDYFDYRPEKVDKVQMDMNQPFELPDESVDVIIYSASLHHARNIWNCLAESYRILRPGGWVVAYPEGLCSPLIARWQLRKLLKSEEVVNGVSENCYLKDQYLYYMEANGFRARACPCIRGKGLKELGMRMLWFANGWLFSRFVLLGQKPAEG